MKKLLLIIACFAVGTAALHAQDYTTPYDSSSSKLIEDQSGADMGIKPGMKYNELKQIYDYKAYVRSDGDRYDLGLVGISSIIPGGGQIECGEYLRGTLWFCGGMACALIASKAKANGSDSVSTIALCAFGVVEVLNIIDAIKIAKVMNMYYQDLGNSNYSLNIAPSIDYAYTPSGYVPTAGVMMSFSF